MLNYETIIKILNKYNYTSTSVHPYVYQSENELGLCYSFIDPKYGLLERIALFDKEDQLENFIKKFAWYEANGKTNNVTMTLANYEDKNPQVIYLRNNRIMADDEMFNLEKYNEQIALEQKAVATSGFLKTAADLLSLYDEKKNSLEQFFVKTNNLTATIKAKYIYLQSLIDKYNNNEEGRNYETTNEGPFSSGISIDLENAAKDKYQQFKANPPAEAEANELIKDIIYLLRSVEQNEKQENLLPIVFDLEQELDSLQQKITLTEEIINKRKNVFSYIYNLKHKYKKIDRRSQKQKKEFDFAAATLAKKRLLDKYDALKVVSYLNYASYLISAESSLSSDYLTLANKFSSKEAVAVINNLPELNYDEMLKELNKQYEKLTVDQKNVLILLNSKYWQLIKPLISIKDYSILPLDKILDNLKLITDFSLIKADCFDNMKVILDDYNNVLLRNTVFKDLDYSSFESLVRSLISKLKVIETINQKIPGLTRGYFETTKYEDLASEGLVIINNNVSELVSGLKANNNKIIIANLNSCPVYYTPQRLIIPEVNKQDRKINYNSKQNSEMVLFVNMLNINEMKEPVTVSRYYSTITKDERGTIVSALNLAGKNIFAEIEMKEG